jgi:secreted trypsin-like serine protease
LDESVQCGNVVPKANPLIVHGEETYQGQFPWHAALYLSEIGSLKYICGGSLVTMSSIVTAAHCVTHTKSRRAINSEKVLVYLGKQNLQKWTGTEQDAKVAEIIVNTEYNSETFFGDIAILKLKDTLRRTNYVRPVCVWSFDNDLRNIVNKQGLVPGW